MVRIICETKGLIVTAGNGGSASTASHLAQALLKPARDTHGLPAVCLNDFVPSWSAWANDAGYEVALGETVRPFLQRGLVGVLMVISASGNSSNILWLISRCRRWQVPVLALLGDDGGKVRGLAERDAGIHCLIVPFERAQEQFFEQVENAHLAIAHQIQIEVKKFLEKQKK